MGQLLVSVGDTCGCDRSSQHVHPDPDTQPHRKHRVHSRGSSPFGAFDPDMASTYSPEDESEIIDSFKVALRNGHMSTIRRFFYEHEDVELLSVTLSNGDNALQIAVKQANYDLIEFILRNGASV